MAMVGHKWYPNKRTYLLLPAGTTTFSSIDLTVFSSVLVRESSILTLEIIDDVLNT